jgi:DNA/RNA endonuclease YhcR with UshA esterase domain
MVGIEVAVMTGTVTSMPSLVNMKYMWVKNAFFYSRSTHSIETGIFLGQFVSPYFG